MANQTHLRETTMTSILLAENPEGKGKCIIAAPSINASTTFTLPSVSMNLDTELSSLSDGIDAMIADIQTDADAIANGAIDISLLYLYAAESKGSRLNVSGGIIDPFSNQNDVNTAGSPNALFSTGHYSPSTTIASDQIPAMTGPTTAGVTITTSSVYSAPYYGYAAADNNPGNISVSFWASAAFGGGQWLKVDFGPSNNKTIGSYTILPRVSYPQDRPSSFRLEGSNDNVLWDTLDSRVGIAGTAAKGIYIVSAPASYRYYRLYITAIAPGGGTCDIAEFELLDVGGKNDMTILSNGFAATIEPASARIGVQASGTFQINVDLTAEVSRDGGISWSLATLFLGETLADGTKYYEDPLVDISGQPSGVSMKYRIKTFNKTSPIVSGVLLQWG